MRRRVQNMIGVKLMNIMIEIFVVNLQLLLPYDIERFVVHSTESFTFTLKFSAKPGCSTS